MILKRIISVFLVIFFTGLQGHSQLNIHALVANHLSILSEHQVELDQTCTKFLEKFQRSNISLDIILGSEAVKKICTIDIDEYPNVSVQESIQAIQYLTLLSLYQKTFKSYIALASTFLNDLLIAQKYWKYEDFYMKQSFFSKNIVYNFYTSKYQNTITEKLLALDLIEDDVAGILGFCLYELSDIKKITREDDLALHLIQTGDRFSQLFNSPESNIQEKRDPAILYAHLVWMHEKLKQHMHVSQATMKENDKTSYIVDHWFGISCATIVTITALVMYSKHQDKVHALYEQSKTVLPNFLQEYIVNPVVGIKEVVWDQKTKKLEHVEPFPDIPKFSNIPKTKDIPMYDGYSTLLVNPVLNPLVNAINETKTDLIQTANDWKDDVVKVANDWKNASEKTLNKKIDEANETIIKNNQVNMYLATLGPVLFGAYWLGSSINTTYDHHVRHKNWYLPMKYIIRSIDQLVNKVARSSGEHNFIDDGKLYMLVQHLKGYISCLTGEELFLMHNDIDELLSFDLNYGQKKGVVDRMYKTYEFLK